MVGISGPPTAVLPRQDSDVAPGRTLSSDPAAGRERFGSAAGFRPCCALLAIAVQLTFTTNNETMATRGRN